MANFQTSQQRANSLWMGSALIEVSDDGGSTYTNLGLVRSVSLTENLDNTEIQADNGKVEESYIGDHTLNLSFEMLEFNPAHLYLIRGGLDTYTAVAGTLVEDEDQVVSSGNWSYGKLILLTGKNADGTCPTINSVTGSVDSTLALNTDYFVVEGASGNWYVYVIDSATVTTESQNITINTDYTPAASEKISTGGLTDISPRWYRLTNKKNVDGTTKYKYIYVYSGKISSGLSAALNADSSSDAVGFPIQIVAEQDTDRTAGDQLFLMETQIV